MDHKPVCQVYTVHSKLHITNDIRMEEKHVYTMGIEYIRCSESEIHIQFVCV